MYFKVALLFIFSIVISGCSFTSMLKPKAPKVENNVTKPIDDNSTIIPLDNSKVVEKSNKYNLKPEPFSLESNEDDPELLGPQTTLEGGLSKLEKEEDTQEESKKPIKNAKDDTKETKEEKL